MTPRRGGSAGAGTRASGPVAAEEIVTARFEDGDALL
jgi:hypothetical protein